MLKRSKNTLTEWGREDMEQDIINYIPRGRGNAKHLETLAAELEKPAAEVKKMIRQTRKNNIICSGSEGYWLPESKEESAAWLRMMKKQALSRLVTIRHTQKTLKGIPEQMELENIDNGSGVM